MPKLSSEDNIRDGNDLEKVCPVLPCLGFPCYRGPSKVRVVISVSRKLKTKKPTSLVIRLHMLAKEQASLMMARNTLTQNVTTL